MHKTSNQDHSLAEYYFHEGTNYCSYEYLGAHLYDDYAHPRFGLPHAERVFVTGDFCDWQTDVHPASRVTDGGIFECAVAGVKEFDAYKFVIVIADGRELLKADPYGYHCETRPGTASRVYNLDGYVWGDGAWMADRQVPPYEKPVSIYELHFGSWRRYADGNYPSLYRKMADELLAYVMEMGYTHIELMPVTEYPLRQSRGAIR